MMREQPVVSVYPLTNYSFGSKDRKQEKDKDTESRMQRLKALFHSTGMRRSVEGILLVQQNNHPHVLMIQIAANFFKLPGGRLRPDEDEVDGLKRKLTTALSPTNPALHTAWDIGELAGVFYRPAFDNLFYTYLPTHVTRPKECKKVFVVPLPDKAMFAVPRNYRLVAVPLYEIYDNMARYGCVIASLPTILSRFRLNLVRSVAPALPQQGQAAADQAQQQHQHDEQRAMVVR